MNLNQHQLLVQTFDGENEILRFYLLYRRRYIDNETQLGYAKDFGISLTVYSALEQGSRVINKDELEIFLSTRKYVFVRSEQSLNKAFNELLAIISEFLTTLGDIDEQSILQIASDQIRDGLTFPIWLIGRFLYCAYISKDLNSINRIIELLSTWDFDLTLKRFVYLVCKLKFIPISGENKYEFMLGYARNGTIVPIQTFVGVESLFLIYKALNKPYEFKMEDYYFVESNILLLHRFQLDGVSAICECYVAYAMGTWLDSQHAFASFDAAASSVKCTTYYLNVFVPVALKYAFLSSNYSYIDRIANSSSSDLLKYAFYKVSADGRVDGVVKRLIKKGNVFVQSIEIWNRKFLYDYSIHTLTNLPDRLNQRVFLKFMKIMCARHEDVELWNHLWIEAAPLIYQELGDKFD